MDSQENTLKQGLQAEEQQETVVAAEVENTENVATEETESKAAPVRPTFKNKQEVLERVKELAHCEEVPSKDEVDFLKTVFYKLHFAEREEAQKKYLEEGGDPEKYQLLPDEDEKAFKAEMAIIREREPRFSWSKRLKSKRTLSASLRLSTR